MATQQGKKKVAGVRNPDRRNGKAWKQGKPPEARIPRKKPRTVERMRKDEEIRAYRERRRQIQIASAAQRRAEQEAELNRQIEEAGGTPNPAVVAKKTRKNG